MPLIMGVDPGLRRTGWGIIHKEGSGIAFIACGVIESRDADSMESRLKTIHDGLKSIAEQYMPHQAAIEETFVNHNGATTLKLGQARGAALLTISLSSLPVTGYSATAVKKAVTGNGRAEKAQVEAMVKVLLPGAKASRADAFDALAVAICHANNHGNTLSAELRRAG